MAMKYVIRQNISYKSWGCFQVLCLPPLWGNMLSFSWVDPLGWDQVEPPQVIIRVSFATEWLTRNWCQCLNTTQRNTEASWYDTIFMVNKSFCHICLKFWWIYFKHLFKKYACAFVSNFLTTNDAFTIAQVSKNAI